MTATAGNFSALTVLAESNAGGIKRRIISCLGPATYSANGSLLNLSSDATDGFGNTYDMFAKVYSCKQVGVSPHTSDKYYCCFVPGAAGAAALGTVKVRDLSAASDAEASGDLSATTFYFEVAGV